MGYETAVVLDPNWAPNWELLTPQPPQVLIRPVLHRFSGGEIHVQFPPETAAKIVFDQRPILLAHRLNSSDNLLELLLTADALRGLKANVQLDLFCPYIPYARQDRRMVPGDPLSIKVFANVLNSAQFGEVFVLDPHSDVGVALIDRCRALPIDSFVAQAVAACQADFVVVPDAGAAKKVFSLVQRICDPFPNLATLQAGKKRDVKNRGRISGTHLEGNPDLAGKSCLIVDDICDGGRTFLELSKLLRQHAAAKVSLYVSHGIFAKGLEVLLQSEISDGRLDGVFTTDSIRSQPNTPGLTQFML